MKTMSQLVREAAMAADTEHAILGMYNNENLSVSEICRRTGVGTGTVYRVLKNNGLRPGRKKWTDGTGHEVVNLDQPSARGSA